MRLLDEAEGWIRRSPRWVQAIVAPLVAAMAVVGVAGMVMLVFGVVAIVVIAVALTAGQFAEERARESRSRSKNGGIFDDRGVESLVGQASPDGYCVAAPVGDSPSRERDIVCRPVSPRRQARA